MVNKTTLLWLPKFIFPSYWKKKLLSPNRRQNFNRYATQTANWFSLVNIMRAYKYHIFPSIFSAKLYIFGGCGYDDDDDDDNVIGDWRTLLLWAGSGLVWHSHIIFECKNVVPWYVGILYTYRYMWLCTRIYSAIWI